jgi:hypothetical protein
MRKQPVPFAQGQFCELLGAAYLQFFPKYSTQSIFKRFFFLSDMLC